jgi:hypothetical protein
MRIEGEEDTERIPMTTTAWEMWIEIFVTE